MRVLSGPSRPELLPNGARVHGTRCQLDTAQAVFNIGAMIRWLDFNDTCLATEWGHPSDIPQQLGAAFPGQAATCDSGHFTGSFPATVHPSP